MLAPDWTWSMAVPVILATVALLWIPGAALASGLGAGRWPALALAPLMTNGLLAGSAILTALVGVRWGRGVAAFWLLAVPAAIWLVRLLLVRAGRRPWRLDAPGVRPWEVVVGLALAVVIAGWVFQVGTIAPGNIPQQSDQIFHLGLVRWMLDRGDLSSLGANGFVTEVPAFYPAAFQDVVANVVLFTGAPIVVVENSLLLVCCALVLPLGTMLMLNTLVATDRRLVALTGLLVLAFTGSPWRVMVWGALWSQVYGTVFIPAVVAIYGWGLLQVLRGKNWGSAALLLAGAVPSISLAHPSATFASAAAALLFSIAVTLQYALREPRRPRRWLPVAGFVVLSVVGPALGTLVAPTDLVRGSEKDLPAVKTLIGVLTFWGERQDDSQVAMTGLFVLAVIGAIACLVRAPQWWLAATGTVFVVLSAMLEADGTRFVWPFTWPWYAWAYRVHGVTDMFGAILAIVGAGTLLALLGRLRRWAAIPAIAVALAALAAVVAVQASTSARVVRSLYAMYGAADWIRWDETQSLRQVATVLPPDAVVAASPWRGGMYLYLLGPQQAYPPTDKAYTPDMELISQRMDRIRTDPAVCAAVQRHHITYALTGGSVMANTEASIRYAGIDGIDEQAGFRVVAKLPPYTVWSVPDCRAQ